MTRMINVPGACVLSRDLARGRAIARVLDRDSEIERRADAADANEELDGGFGWWTHFYVGLAVLLVLAIGAAAAVKFFW